MNDAEKEVIRKRVVGDLKQACLDLSREAMVLFDRFEEYGIEAAWESDGAVVIMRMEEAHEILRSFLAQQATSRMLALGVTPENLARMVMRRK